MDGDAAPTTKRPSLPKPSLNFLRTRKGSASDRKNRGLNKNAQAEAAPPSGSQSARGPRPQEEEEEVPPSGSLTERGTASTGKKAITPLGAASSAVRELASLPTEAMHQIKGMAALAKEEVTTANGGVLGDARRLAANAAGAVGGAASGLAHGDLGAVAKATGVAAVASDISAGVKNTAHAVLDVVEDTAEASLSVGKTLAAGLSIGGSVVKSAFKSSESVRDHDAPTPPDRWFTPGPGWPTSVENEPRDAKGRKVALWEWEPPRALVPAGARVNGMYQSLDDKCIGELKVEIIQARAFPHLPSPSLAFAHLRSPSLACSRLRSTHHS